MVLFNGIVFNDLEVNGKVATKGRRQKKKSKKQDFGPLSVDPYPPTIKREVLIRDNFDFFLPPTLLTEIGTFLKKNWAPKHI